MRCFILSLVVLVCVAAAPTGACDAVQVVQPVFIQSSLVVPVVESRFALSVVNPVVVQRVFVRDFVAVQQVVAVQRIVRVRAVAVANVKVRSNVRAVAIAKGGRGAVAVAKVGRGGGRAVASVRSGPFRTVARVRVR